MKSKLIGLTIKKRHVHFRGPRDRRRSFAGNCLCGDLQPACRGRPHRCEPEERVAHCRVPAGTPNGGLGGPMWLTLVDGSGIVCAVTNSLDGSAYNADVTADIWLGSRVISAQKANTANAFSTGRLALSTANLYSAVQPGGSLYGLQASNPVDATAAYEGRAADFGTPKDPLVGHRIGGINVFGGGLALYRNGKKIGAIGVSGDTSCTDHVVAWKVRAITTFATVPDAAGFDAMAQDITPNPAGGTGIKRVRLRSSNLSQQPFAGAGRTRNHR